MDINDQYEPCIVSRAKQFYDISDKMNVRHHLNARSVYDCSSRLSWDGLPRLHQLYWCDFVVELEKIEED